MSKVCFSYIRFSSKPQKNGDSEDRQSPIAPQVAKEKGWIFNPQMTAKDLGVSAFKGDNIETLQTIIQLAKDGKIPQGSVMVIEAFDRFSRANLSTAEDLMKNVLQAGIEIYVYRGGHHLTKESIEKPIDRIIALLELSAANEYSAKLSYRIKSAYDSKAKKILNGERVKINTLPMWINDDWTLNGKAQVIRQIFQMYLSGKGAGLIARELNQTNVKTFTEKGKWGQGYIYRLLSNRQMIGEYVVKGETVKNYLPSVVTDETFMKVQAKLSDNAGKRPAGNGKGNLNSLFAGVAYCVCGERISINNAKGGVKYLTCHGKLKGLGCVEPMIKYTLETSFTNLLRIKSDELISDESGNTVNSHVQILNGQLSEVRKEADNIAENLATVKSDRLAKKLAALETMEQELIKKVELESAKKVTLKGSGDRLNKIIQRLDTLSTDNDLRITVQGWVRENVNKITVNRSEKTYSVEFKNGQYITMNMNGTVIACKSFVELFGKNVENLTTHYQEQTFKTA